MRLDERINRCYEALTANDREMLGQILRDRQGAAAMNSTRLAQSLHVSRTTLVRLMKKLDISTYAEFKLLLTEGGERRLKALDLEEIAKNYHSMIDELKRHDYETPCRLIGQAETIYLYGTGNEQKAIGEEFKRIFLILGKCCIDLFDLGEVELASPRFKRDDLFLAISLSGETPQALEVIRHVRETGIATMSLTRWENNSLARLCGHNLYVGTRTVGQGESGGYEMVAAFYIMLDILSARYMEYRRERHGD